MTTRYERQKELWTNQARALPPLLNVFRFDQPPMPETVAYIRRIYGPTALIIVDPTMTADDLREAAYDRFVGDER